MVALHSAVSSLGTPAGKPSSATPIAEPDPLRATMNRRETRPQCFTDGILVISFIY